MLLSPLLTFNRQRHRFLQLHRLKDAERCSKLRRCGSVVAWGCWRVYRLDNGLPHPRIAVIVPKRFVRLAVKRNLIRRLVRDNFRRRCGFDGGCDYLWVTASSPAELSGSKLREQIDKVSALLSASS